MWDMYRRSYVMYIYICYIGTDFVFWRIVCDHSNDDSERIATQIPETRKRRKARNFKVVAVDDKGQAKGGYVACTNIGSYKYNDL